MSVSASSLHTMIWRPRVRLQLPIVNNITMFHDLVYMPCKGIA